MRRFETWAGAGVRGGAALLAPPLLVVLLVSGCHGRSTAASATPGASATTSTSASACPTSNTTPFAKSKFVLHVGLAAGTFHHFIYDPFRAGAFHRGAHGRVLALAKAGATALFDAHEAQKPVADVEASPALCRALIAPLDAIGAKFAALKAQLGHGDTDGLDNANSSIATIKSISGQGGVPIPESTNEGAG